jgi:hypothetical protein
MEYINDLLKKRNLGQLVLVVLFVIYLLMGLEIPEPFATIIDTQLGKIIIALIALMLFAYSNPILGILGLVVAYTLIQNATATTGLGALAKYAPTEEKKWSPFNARHQFPYTLEQEIVKKMASTKFNPTYVKAPYKPILNDTHDASYVNDM